MDYLKELRAMPAFKVGDRVELSPDDYHGAENGSVLYRSIADPVLYLVLVDEEDKDKDHDHRHRLVSRDCMDPE